MGCLDTLILITAFLTLLANLRLSAIKEPGTNSTKDSARGESATKSDIVNESSWQNDDAALCLRSQCQFKERIGCISFKPSTVSHATIDNCPVNFRVFVYVFNAIIMHEVVRGITAMLELSDVIPPLSTDSIRFPIMFPNANSSETLLHNISTRDALVKVIVWVSGTVPPIIGAQIEAHVHTIRSLAVTPDTIIYILVGGEISVFT
mmetsp:Transcript_38364/g.57458  ORF Transcript_38364/g.57458 Transcript_38364/m.57458 type:complete len:206 (-) Transcript_38364:832-1449(-)